MHVGKDSLEACGGENEVQKELPLWLLYHEEWKLETGKMPQGIVQPRGARGPKPH